eukprot:SAG22_NODE_47_length_24699_cov_13.602317_11_plen_120_part_00
MIGLGAQNVMSRIVHTRPDMRELQTVPAPRQNAAGRLCELLAHQNPDEGKLKRSRTATFGGKKRYEHIFVFLKLKKPIGYLCVAIGVLAPNPDSSLVARPRPPGVMRMHGVMHSLHAQP